MTADCDVAVVGGGIVGLAHAWMAARRGLRVVVLERSAAAEGASVRNFGMIWPIGQPAGELYELALQSHNLWLQLGTLGVLDVEDCGSIHLTHRDDELAVLQEFCDQGSHQASMLSVNQVLERTHLANPENLLGGMLSTTELRVDPRSACRHLASWLQADKGIEFHYSTTVVSVDGKRVHAADRQEWTAEKIIICSGSDLRTLYPDILKSSVLRLCKLQLLIHCGRSSRWMTRKSAFKPVVMQVAGRSVSPAQETASACQ